MKKFFSIFTIINVAFGGTLLIYFMEWDWFLKFMLNTVWTAIILLVWFLVISPNLQNKYWEEE